MEKSAGATPATTRASGQVGTKTTDGKIGPSKSSSSKDFAPRGMRLGKHLSKGIDFVKWACKKIPGYVFKFFTQQKQACVVCGTGLVYNNSRQMRLYCSKACRTARHNIKYLQGARRHK